MSYAHADQARQFLAARLPAAPAVGVVLGSGLAGFSRELSDAVEIPFPEIPHWPRSTVSGHAGQLIAGRLCDKVVAVLAGRSHLYEGYSARDVTFPTRVLGLLGVGTLVLTNAAGGINAAFQPPQLVLISDHINLQGSNPLAGENEDRFGPRFPDLSGVYPKRLRDLARACAGELGFELPEGVYAAVLGPSYETPAEIRHLRSIGADMVGMSTVPEAIVAAHMGLPVLGISSISNMAAGLSAQKISHQEVLEAGRRISDRLTALLKKVIPRL
ncbi:MAG TPA: purine-nucleoside phosphorylase [Bryobacterales bacterium]|nr:purine-nucleoside phosphorylase [Bryobacterales bacterium]